MNYELTPSPKKQPFDLPLDENDERLIDINHEFVDDDNNDDYDENKIIIHTTKDEQENHLENFINKPIS